MSLNAETALNTREESRLETLEQTIRAGLSTFYEVGAALAEISEKRLYRAEFATFDAYCREKWQMGRKRAYQLIAAAELHEELSTVVDVPIGNEAQARELLRVPEEDRAALWSAAVEMADGKPPTALLIEEAREALLPAAKQELEGGALRARAGEIAAADDADKRARDLERLVERIRHAWKIAERYGLLSMASALKRWEQKAQEAK